MHVKYIGSSQPKSLDSGQCYRVYSSHLADGCITILDKQGNRLLVPISDLARPVLRESPQKEKALGSGNSTQRHKGEHITSII